MLAGWLRRNGVPYSQNASITEYFTRFTHPRGRRLVRRDDRRRGSAVPGAAVHHQLELQEGSRTTRSGLRQPCKPASWLGDRRSRYELTMKRRDFIGYAGARGRRPAARRAARARLAQARHAGRDGQDDAPARCAATSTTACRCSRACRTAPRPPGRTGSCRRRSRQPWTGVRDAVRVGVSVRRRSSAASRRRCCRPIRASRRAKTAW